ncbi:MAG: hypothetical protein M3Q64_02425 [bacterium]|nr:hypothetical protein [bacterium]
MQTQKATVLSVTTLRTRASYPDTLDMVELLFGGRSYYSNTDVGQNRIGQEVEVFPIGWDGEMPTHLMILTTG